MKTLEMREMPTEDLRHKHDAWVTEYFHMRIKHTMGQLEDPLVLRRMRHDIARARTLLTERGDTDTRRRRRRTGSWTTKKTKDSA